MTITATLDVDVLAARFRASGYQVMEVAPGKWASAWPEPVLHPGIPNDHLDLIRMETDREVEWVHAVVPTAQDAYALSLALAGFNRVQVPAHMSGHDPRRSSRAVLAGEARRIRGPRAITDHHQGRTVHVVDIPVDILHRGL